MRRKTSKLEHQKHKKESSEIGSCHQDNKDDVLLERLEPRYMYDGAMLVTAVDAVENAEDTSGEMLLNVGSVVDSEDKEKAFDSEGILSDEFDHYQHYKEVVIVDERVQDVEVLLKDIPQGAAIEVISSDVDGVEAISELLQKYQNLDAVHIISHGQQGELSLGETNLNGENIATYSDTLGTWGGAIKEGGDLLFYGCNVAEGEIGESLINALYGYVKADVTASSDLTGSSDLGGDWDLEYSKGSIESSSIFSSSLKYNALLDSNLTPTKSGSETLINTQTNADKNDPIVIDLASGQYAVFWESYDSATTSREIKGQLYDATHNKSGSEFTVNTNTSGVQDTIDAVKLSNDGFVVVWESSASGNNEIKAQRYDSSGVAQGSEISVNTETSDNQDTPAVAALTNGGFVVVWESTGQDNGSTDGIYGQRYDSSGVAQGSEFLVNTTTTNNQDDPDIVGLTGGGFVVAWESQGQDGGGDGVYAAVYDNNGSVTKSEFLVNVDTSFAQNEPAVAALSGGGFVVTWEHSDAANDTETSIYGRIFDSAGTNQTGDLVLKAYSATELTNPKVSDLASDEFVVTWEDNTDIFAQRFNSSGVANGSELAVNTTTSNSQTHPSIATLSTGDFIIVWDSEESAGDDVRIHVYNADGTDEQAEFAVGATVGTDQDEAATVALTGGGYVIVWESRDNDGDVDGIYGQIYDANGATSGSEFLVNTTTSDSQNAPSVAALDNGGFVVVWTSEGQDAGDSTNETGIYGQRFDSVGTKVGSEFQANTTESGSQTEPHVAALTGSAFVVVWTSGTDVYQQRFDSSANKSGSEIRVNTTTANNQGKARVVELSGGGYIVVWEADSAQDGELTGVYAQAYDANGDASGSEFLVNTTTAKEQQDPDIAALNDGGFVVVWEAKGSETGLSNSWGVVGQLYNASATKVGSEFVVNTTINNTQDDPSVSALADGGFVVVWEDSNADGDNNGIYGQRYDSSGTAFGNEFQVNTYTTGEQDDPVVAGLVNNNKLVVAWESDGQISLGEEIYGQFYSFKTKPTAANNTVTAEEDIAYSLTAADFNFSDLDSDTLSSVQITSLESVGSLQLNGADVTLNQVISRVDIDAGLLTFTSANNQSGSSYDSFGFSVNDGTYDSVSSYTMTIDVTALNDEPTLSASGSDPTFTENGASVS
ncbi:DUF4347 domain-containing protein, partial [Fangia hongkongensis]|uniref:DUF4347 domain-containing protein n=1 Tax=Fangia hongkongensis TaxID=270495 RepID=UPI001904A563